MDDAKMQRLAQTLARSYEGALVSGMIYLGDELGLYEAMAGEGPLTSGAVAARAGLHERFVREWLHVQVAAGIVDLPGRQPGDDVGESRFELAYASADEGWRLALDTGQLWAAGWNLMRLVQIDALRGDEELAHAHAAELETLVARSGASVIGQYSARPMSFRYECSGPTPG